MDFISSPEIVINKDIMDIFYSFVIFSTLPGINNEAGGNTDMKGVGLFYCLPIHNILFMDYRICFSVNYFVLGYKDQNLHKNK